jgi:hypothetical protein
MQQEQRGRKLKKQAESAYFQALTHPSYTSFIELKDQILQFAPI